MPASQHRVLLGWLTGPWRAGVLVLLEALCLCSVAGAGDFHPDDRTRQQIIREFLAEMPYLHCELPRGHIVRIAGGAVIPDAAELKLQSLIPGTVASIGERVRITAVKFDRHGLVFDINGGAKGHTSWRDHLQIGVATPAGLPTSQVTSDDNGYGPQHGASIQLEWAGDVPLTAERVRELLAPVLDFHSQTAAEAYEKSLPPHLAAAIRQHRALVGMDREMVLNALGRPPKRVRETEDGKEFEEWIYGEPPRNVQFIRFLGEKVVRIEEIQVGSTKKIRTEDEVGELPGRRPTSADAEDAGNAPAAAPTLLRPGENTAPHDARPAPPTQQPIDPGASPTGGGPQTP